jgi:hypothetical protein
VLRCARCDRRKVKINIETDDDPTTTRKARRKVVDGGAEVIEMPKRRASR